MDSPGTAGSNWAGLSGKVPQALLAMFNKFVSKTAVPLGKAPLTMFDKFVSKTGRALAKGALRSPHYVRQVCLQSRPCPWERHPTLSLLRSTVCLQSRPCQRERHPTLSSHIRQVCVQNGPCHWERQPTLSSLCSRSLSPEAAVPLGKAPHAMLSSHVRQVCFQHRRCHSERPPEPMFTKRNFREIGLRFCLLSAFAFRASSRPAFFALRPCKYSVGVPTQERSARFRDRRRFHATWRPCVTSAPQTRANASGQARTTPRRTKPPPKL